MCTYMGVLTLYEFFSHPESLAGSGTRLLMVVLCSRLPRLGFLPPWLVSVWGGSPWMGGCGLEKQLPVVRNPVIGIHLGWAGRTRLLC